MACACKVNQEINKIHKYYSYNKDKSSAPKTTINGKDAAQTILIYLLLLPLTPIMFLFVLFFSFFSEDRMISMRKFLYFVHTVRHGREQQIIQS